MKEIKVSVIVPIHNAGIYLNKCLESLIAQTLRELEIILILDCPTDGSDKIVEEFKEKDDRIIIIRNKTNLHIGNSRNSGLEIAKGKYVSFCDHDDYMDSRMYEILYEKAEISSLDLVCSPYVKVKNGKVEKLVHYPELPSEKLPRIICETTIGPSLNGDPWEVLSISGAVWNKLFKSSIIKEYKLRFVNTNKSSAEDLIFLMEYSFYCQKAGLVDDLLYYHVIRIDSTGKTLAYTAPDKIIFYLKYTYSFLFENNLFINPIIQKCFHNRVKKEVVNCILKEYQHNKSLWRVWKVINLFKRENLVVETFRLFPSYVFWTSTITKKVLFKILRFLLVFT